MSLQGDIIIELRCGRELWRKGVGNVSILMCNGYTAEVPGCSFSKKGRLVSVFEGSQGRRGIQVAFRF